MCGIGGFAGQLLPDNQLKKCLNQICKALRHRGPDDNGYIISKQSALCSTRLAIRDPSLGKQPMSKNGVSLVFNGEIYNTDQLLSELNQPQMTTQSDTEVILEGYLQWGPEIFEKLSGMFALAIWDQDKQQLLLARDRWGEKPLYFAKCSSGLAFASEIKGLKPWPQLNWTINLSDIHAFLKLSYVPCPHTGWQDIYKLNPGHYLVWKNHRTKLQRYYHPRIKLQATTPTDLRQIIEESVTRCAISDKPIGSFLSGGLDSSIVVSNLKKTLPDFPVFSIDWDHPDFSESAFSSLLCQNLGLKHYLVKCTPRFMIDHFDQIVSNYGEPFGDESMIPTTCLAIAAKQKVDVVLTGDGADEFFHGYQRYFFSDSSRNYTDVFAPMDSAIRKLILNPDLYHHSTAEISFKKAWQLSQYDQRRERSFQDIQTYLADDILTKVDRATMSVGLESRAPFLSPILTTLALNLPMHLLIQKKNQGKWLLKESAKTLIPRKIINRKKLGFGVPIAEWFSGKLNSWMSQRLLNGALTSTGWFSQTGLLKISQKPKMYSRAIFNLLVLESWMRQNKD